MSPPKSSSQLLLSQSSIPDQIYLSSSRYIDQTVNFAFPNDYSLSAIPASLAHQKITIKQQYKFQNQKSNQMSSELEEITFTFEDMEKAVNDLLDSYLGPKQYDEKQVPKWINEINEMMMAKLVDTQKPFKFLVNTMIMQRKGANVVIVHSSYLDTTFDQYYVVGWPRQKNKPQQSKDTIQCMVSIYILSALNSLTYAKNQL